MFVIVFDTKVAQPPFFMKVATGKGENSIISLLSFDRTFMRKPFMFIFIKEPDKVRSKI